jgi:hypothetical protein
MAQTTEDKKSRIQRIKEAHPEARDVQIRAMLIAHYDKVSKDPACRGPEGVQVQLECLTDVLCRMNEHDFRDQVAKAAELWPVSWDELEDIMNQDD